MAAGLQTVRTRIYGGAFAGWGKAKSPGSGKLRPTCAGLLQVLLSGQKLVAMTADEFVQGGLHGPGHVS
jgi:hypothetical protein